MGEDYIKNEVDFTIERQVSEAPEDFDYVVHVSKEYHKFKNVASNRLLKQRNINALIESMRQKQLIIPIICTKNEKGDLIVIDGQHRIYVCEELQLPIYYIIVPGYDITDIQRANQVGINWKIDDFIHMFVEEGIESYIQLQHMCEDHNLSINTLLKIISYFKKEKISETTYAIKTGAFDISDVLFQTSTFLDELAMFEGFEFSKTSTFVKAFFTFYNYEGYDTQKMHEQIDRLGYKLERRGNEREYLALLCNDIFAFQSKTCTFKYDKLNNKFYSFK